MRCLTVLMLVVCAACGSRPPRPAVMSLCDLSRDFTAYRGKQVAVRGVYFYGLRQACPQTCANGLWPSRLDLIGSDDGDDSGWVALDSAMRMAEVDARGGSRMEVWVTAVGELRARDHRSPVGPCDQMFNSGFGHLGGFPAQLVVKSFEKIEVVPNANSSFDYSHIYRGAL